MMEKIKIKFKYFKILKYFFQKDYKYKKENFDVIFFGNGLRTTIIKNKYSERLADSVIDDLSMLGMKCISIDYPISINKIEQNKIWGNVGSINKKYVAALILTKLFNKNFKIILYKSIIKQLNAKYIFTQNANSDLCEACYSLKKPVIEILHGIGYTYIPWDWDKRKKEQLPTLILSLDDVSLRTFSFLDNRGVKNLKIEHPFYKRFYLEKYQDRIDKKMIIDLPSNAKSKKIILFTVHHGLSQEDGDCTGLLPNGVIYDGFEEIFKTTKNEIFWAIRIHPVQLYDEKYKRHVQYIETMCQKHVNVDFEWATLNSFPVVLSRCTGHITMESMSCYDASYFGICSLALSPRLIEESPIKNYFEDLVASGYLIKKYFESDSVLEWVRRVEKKNPKNILSDDLWNKFCNDYIQ
jgi:hypothetical protein